MKRCVVCGELKPVTDFYSMAGMRDGYRNDCKVCNLAARKRRYQADPAKAIARVKKWQQQNAERLNAYRREHAGENFRLIDIGRQLSAVAVHQESRQPGHEKDPAHIDRDAHDRDQPELLARQRGDCQARQLIARNGSAGDRSRNAAPTAWLSKPAMSSLPNAET